MRMIYKMLFAGFLFATSVNLAFADVMDRRQNNIGVKQIYGSYGHRSFVTGTINKSPNFVAENCVGSEFFWRLGIRI